jgi:actin-related protein 6
VRRLPSRCATADRPSPAAPPYHSALSLTSSENYLTTYPVTKAEYQEHGPDICRRRFGGPSSLTPLATGVSAAGVQLDEETDDDELDRLYAMGIDVVGNGRKKKIRIEEEEVTTGGQGWGGRRRRG